MGDDGPEDTNVVEGSIIVIRRAALDGIDHFESRDNLTEDGVTAIEMRRARMFTIIGTRHGIHVVTTMSPFEHCGVDLIEQRIVVGLAPHNVELRSRTGLIWIDIVTRTGSSKHAPLVEDGWITEFGRHHGDIGFVGYEFIGCRMTAGAVARLNHEVGDDTMEEQRVVITRLDMLKEIVAMERRFVEELYYDVAFGSLQSNFVPHILCLFGST